MGHAQAAANHFLTDLWKQGGLMGSTAAGAFAVEVGLGSTMTDKDVARGVIRIVITAAISHPAEFMVITIEQAQTAMNYMAQPASTPVIQFSQYPPWEIFNEPDMLHQDEHVPAG